MDRGRSLLQTRAALALGLSLAGVALAACSSDSAGPLFGGEGGSDECANCYYTGTHATGAGGGTTSASAGGSGGTTSTGVTTTTGSSTSTWSTSTNSTTSTWSTSTSTSTTSTWSTTTTSTNTWSTTTTSTTTSSLPACDPMDFNCLMECLQGLPMCLTGNCACSGDGGLPFP